MGSTGAVRAEVLVSADDLSVAYRDRRAAPGEFAVGGVTFTLGAGEILAVVGETGSGKSTLARTVAGRAGAEAGSAGAAPAGTPGVAEITGGALTVTGVAVRGMRRRARDRLTLRVGYIAQDAGSLLSPNLTVTETIAEPIFVRDHRFDSREATDAVATLLDAVRLPLGIMDQYPYELSRGQRQRVAIARALVLDPVVLVADDPTAGVDVLSRGPIVDLLHDLRVSRGLATLLISNRITEVRRIADRVAVMQRGTFIGFGTVDEVLNDPRHRHLEELSAH
ncbi:ABC transporter family protein [Glaciihabitans tibetensis]|uniref:ABC transporter family protein n=1 Tax=Glaciihabitans tibetensis TaxID=1266600 RepID=A0A2T0VJ44_9MICO|nr:ATP-binding cassette domain-containing protein [Glaciihabitans tibetensis]PRY70252.1 ABC transporter family protein [Glaciihabitans tibetensis]